MRLVLILGALAWIGAWIGLWIGTGVGTGTGTGTRAAVVDAPTDQDVLGFRLSADDRQRYKAIFAFQEAGEWSAADRIIAKLENALLLGHVLAQRHLHPARDRVGYRELADWLDLYADHPDARRIRRLALRKRPAGQARPTRPVTKPSSLLTARPDSPAHRSKKALSKSDRRLAARLKARVRRNLRRVWLTKTERMLRQAKTRRLLDRFELDEAYSGLAAGWLYHGEVEKGFALADDVAARSGSELPISHWTAGLAAWRLGQFHIAARHFEQLALSKKVSAWNKTAGAYWAARAYFKIENLAKVQRWLSAAAMHPRTFYGLLARRRLSQRPELDFLPPLLSASKIGQLRRTPEGARAVALLQVDQRDRAEQELLWFEEWHQPGISGALLGLAVYAELPALGLKLAERTSSNRRSLGSDHGWDAAAYPLPPWQPRNGFQLDRALVFAVMRQESSFDPAARSPEGARGLMQLMPRTAAALDPKRALRGRDSNSLYDPAINIELGQRYLKQLLRNRHVGDDLLRLAAAYNAGPGNLKSWERRMAGIEDPLLFIESLPLLETRLFVERVMTNMWIYRLRLGQTAPSLDALAVGEWPRYESVDRLVSQGPSSERISS